MEGPAPLGVLYREDGYVRQSKERMGNRCSHVPGVGAQLRWVCVAAATAAVNSRMGEAGRLTSYRLARPASSPRAWSRDVLGWVPNREIGSSAELMPGDSRRVGVTGPAGDAGAGVAECVGRGLRGSGVGCSPKRLIVEGGIGKNCVWAGVRRHVALIVGLRSHGSGRGI
jgi:hypothetical protein